MTKLQVTAQQRANAIFAVEVMWPSVPPENVIKNLTDWRKPTWKVTCGTVACFGGWVAVNPHFMAQGIKASLNGAPMNEGCWCGGDVADELFGSYGLFDPRSASERGTDHEIVTKRLNRLIRNSVVKP